MVSSGLLNLGNTLHMESLWILLSWVVQEDLDEVRVDWNILRPRPSRFGTVPWVADVLYHFPQRSCAVECKVAFQETRLVRWSCILKMMAL